jgi:antitoxin component YwqK of YwqJK toxin-antitoxin module
METIEKIMYWVNGNLKLKTIYNEIKETGTIFTYYKNGEVMGVTNFGLNKEGRRIISTVKDKYLYYHRFERNQIGFFYTVEGHGTNEDEILFYI